MDILKAEIASKRKRPLTATAEAASSGATPSDANAATGGSSSSASPPPAKKYLRRGEEEARREEERRRQEERRKEESRLAQLKREEGRTGNKRTKSSTPDAGPASPGTAASLAATQAASDALADALKESTQFNISPTEAVRRLRAKGQPIRLFGESDKERRLRLRALELIEERGESVGQNDFMKALQGAESGVALELIEKRRDAEKGVLAGNGKANGAGDAKDRDGAPKSDDASGGAAAAAASRPVREGVGMDGALLDLSLVRKDVNRVYPMVYYTIKGLLKDWEDALAERPVEVRQSVQGKLVTATQVQSAEYLKPLFKQLRSRTLAPDILMRLAEIVHYMQKREYRNASDSYLQLSIGNAPWPIGVTMVGIHERSGREKIFSSNVAHVLNDEVSRKYIQSLKRLMTFAQTKYPPASASMLMG